jgi:hypothetical protein
MKNLLACLAILAAFNVTAQTETSNFPYNPDVDQDGFIGVNDILQLLSTFGEAFQVQVTLNLDSTSAVYFPPNWATEYLSHAQCATRCDSLPGPWQIMSYQGFVTHAAAIRETYTGTRFFWQGTFETNSYSSGSYKHPVHHIKNNPGDPYAESSSYNYQYYNYSWVGVRNTNEEFAHCLCELRQRPRVEYDFCEGSMTAVQSCAAGKVSSGWYPLELTSAGSNTFVQTFWRWED